MAPPEHTSINSLTTPNSNMVKYCVVCYCIAVLKHHMIKGHRCDVRKALSKEEMRDSKFSGRGSYIILIITVVKVTRTKNNLS